MTEQTPAVSEERGYRKALRGIVVSDKMDKTIVVEVEDRKKHSLYGKVLKTSKRVKAHDEDNTAGVGERPPRRDPPAVRLQAVASGGDRRARQVIDPAP